MNILVVFLCPQFYSYYCTRIYSYNCTRSFIVHVPTYTYPDAPTLCVRLIDDSRLVHANTVCIYTRMVRPHFSVGDLNSKFEAQHAAQPVKRSISPRCCLSRWRVDLNSVQTPLLCDPHHTGPDSSSTHSWRQHIVVVRFMIILV
jgi:hypothetical protein